MKKVSLKPVKILHPGFHYLKFKKRFQSVFYFHNWTRLRKVGKHVFRHITSLNTCWSYRVEPNHKNVRKTTKTHFRILVVHWKYKYLLQWWTYSCERFLFFWDAQIDCSFLSFFKFKGGTVSCFSVKKFFMVQFNERSYISSKINPCPCTCCSCKV